MRQAEVVTIVPEHIEFGDEEASVRKRELSRIELEKRERIKQAALAKFNFMLHITAYISGCAYLLILGILLPRALPYMFIPIGLWTAGIGYHGYRVFHRKEEPEDKGITPPEEH